MKYFNYHGTDYKVDVYGYDPDTKSFLIDVYYKHQTGNYYFYKSYVLKGNYRHEKTWDDHLGNTDCGYYVNIPLKYFSGNTVKTGKKRVYCF